MFGGWIDSGIRRYEVGRSTPCGARVGKRGLAKKFGPLLYKNDEVYYPVKVIIA